MVPNNVPKVEFVLCQHAKTVEDDSEVFPNVARILDAMLCRIDTVDPVLVAYLETINLSIETCVLLAKGIIGTSKHGKNPKKATKASPLLFTFLFPSFFLLHLKPLVLILLLRYDHFFSLIPTSLVASTISHTFSNIIHQPISSLFSSQSIDGPKSTSDSG